MACVKACTAVASHYTSHSNFAPIEIESPFIGNMSHNLSISLRNLDLDPGHLAMNSRGPFGGHQLANTHSQDGCLSEFFVEGSIIYVQNGGEICSSFSGGGLSQSTPGITRVYPKPCKEAKRVADLFPAGTLSNPVSGSILSGDISSFAWAASPS